MARLTVSILFAILILAFAATGARAYIYVADDANNSIDRVTLDGQLIQYGFIQGASNPGQMLVDSNYVYWMNHGDGAIGHARIDGTDVNPDWISDAYGYGNGLAIDGSHIYWSNYQAGIAYVGRANIDGTGVNSHWLTGVSGSEGGWGVAVDSTHVYWISKTYNPNLYSYEYFVGEANLDGSDQNDYFIPLPGAGTTMNGLTAAGGYLYFDSGAYVAKVSVDGSYSNMAFGQAGGGAGNVATDSVHVYWTTGSSYPPVTVVNRSNVDGTNFVQPFFVAKNANIAGLAIDSLVPPAANWPSSSPTGGSGQGSGSSASPSGPGKGSGSDGASGPKFECIVPKLHGLSPSRAKHALTRAHCMLSKVTRRRGHGVRRGRVLHSIPASGTHLAGGARVSLVIAR